MQGRCARPGRLLRAGLRRALAAVAAAAFLAVGAEARAEEGPLSDRDTEARAEEGPPSDRDAEARAEEGPPSDRGAEARALFEAAELAFQDGRVADAAELFRRSLTLAPRPSTAWNLAVTLRATNEHLEAAAVLDRLVEGRYGVATEEELADAAELGRELAAHLGMLRIEAAGPAVVEVVVDRVDVGSLRPGGVLERRVEAGPHVIVARVEGGEPEETSVEVGPGETTEVLLSRPRRPLPPAPPPRPLWQDPWLWGMLAGAVALVAVAVGVTAWWLVDGQAPEGPYVDPVWGNTEALSSPY